MVRSVQNTKIRHRGGEMAGQMDYTINKCTKDMKDQSFLLGDLDGNN